MTRAVSSSADKGRRKPPDAPPPPPDPLGQPLRRAACIGMQLAGM